MRYLAIAFFILLVACSKKTTSSTVTTITEKIDTVEIVRFDTITIQGDTVILTNVIECDSITNKPKPFKLHARSGRASLSVVVNAAGELKADGVCDSLQKIVALKDKEISRLRLEKTAVTKVLQPSKFQVWFDYTCKILAAILVLLVGLKLTKML